MIPAVCATRSSFHQTASSLQDLASLLGDIKGKLLTAFHREQNEWMVICRIDTKEQLRKMVSDVDSLFQQISPAQWTEHPRLEAAQALWKDFIEQWEKEPLLEVEQRLVEVLNVLSPPKSAPFCEEEKVDTQAIFTELLSALRSKDLERLRILMHCPSVWSLSPNEMQALLQEVFDFPESFPLLESYLSNLSSQMLVDLLTYGIQKDKWLGVQFLLGRAILVLDAPALCRVNEQLSPETPEPVRTIVEMALSIKTSREEEKTPDRFQAFLSALRRRDLVEIRTLIQQGFYPSSHQMSAIVQEAHLQGLQGVLLRELLMHSIAQKQWNTLVSYILSNSISIDLLLFLSEQLPNDAPEHIRGILEGALNRKLDVPS